MFSEITLLATPANARKLLRLSQVVNLEIPESMIELACKDVCSLPNLTDTENDALQFFKDHNGRCIVPYSKNSEVSLMRVIKEYIKDKGRVCVVTTKERYSKWEEQLGSDRLTVFPWLFRSRRDPISSDEKINNDKEGFDIVIIDNTLAGYRMSWNDKECLYKIMKENFSCIVTMQLPGAVSKFPNPIVSLYNLDKDLWSSLDSMLILLNAHMIDRGKFSTGFLDKQITNQYFEAKGYKYKNITNLLSLFNVCLKLQK